jgi:peptidoglycan/LPS O-acetylase OafA/YrhL
MRDRKDNAMIRFRRGIPFVSMVLVAAAVAIVLAAALTSWWVLLALMPLAMMVGCVAMMAAHRRTPRGPSAARCGCCVVGALSGVTAEPERKRANAALTR